MQNYCVSEEKTHYSGTFNATIHVVAGGGGSHLSDYTSLQATWSNFKDHDFGFVELTAFNHSSLLFEFKKKLRWKSIRQFLDHKRKTFLVVTPLVTAHVLP
ncbi:hypothetical protein SUGI_0260720 [Cryptomeria japonica]|nr:hypothetical protein SUGI_0260720 [Cryptomeria japonica]